MSPAQAYITQFLDIDEAMQTIAKDVQLCKRMAVFAGPQCGADRQLKGASNFLRCLVRMAERNADREKHGRR